MNLYDRACADLNGTGREALLTTVPVLCELARLQTAYDSGTDIADTLITQYDVDVLLAADSLPFTFPKFNFRIDPEDRTIYIVPEKDTPFAPVAGSVIKALPFNAGAGMSYRAWGIGLWVDGEDSMVVVAKLEELIATSYVMYLEDVEHMCEDFIVTPNTIWFNARTLALVTE